MITPWMLINNPWSTFTYPHYYKYPMNIEHQFLAHQLPTVPRNMTRSCKMRLFNSPLNALKASSNICHRYISFEASVLALQAIPGKVAPGVALVTSDGEEERGEKILKNCVLVSTIQRKYWWAVCLHWLLSWWLVSSFERLVWKTKNIKNELKSDK